MVFVIPEGGVAASIKSLELAFGAVKKHCVHKQKQYTLTGVARPGNRPQVPI